MKIRALICLLGLGLCLAVSNRPALAQDNPAATSADKKAEFEEIFKKLSLTPRQKFALAKIVRNAKASGQDRLVTAEQIAKELTPDQKQILMAELKAEAAAKKAAPDAP